ncbi:Tellurite resistance protein TerB [Octadecabacter temperatus]|uniref:Dna-J like membrane chaperone protein n=1 Tax=Octadecabacter temperatus TaxID=1458307 RepID=A0A0K0Y296_9RHOB|nr:TerB family tellurite resistance protein [Octadecabacter temperatus]AKS45022.1 Dna-J like membrane chaperone protein [Octadecabacter temperatus]SIN84643.1 Tellurite resistance protein TerB [Octadecabacter temperatus]
MRKFLPIIALSFGLTTTASTADAYIVSGEDLRFVAETSLPGQAGEPVSLCHLVDFTNALFVPVYTSVQSYALSPDGCVGDSYRALSAEQFSAMQASGLLPAELPEAPRATIKDLLWGHAWLIVAAIGILFSALIAFRDRKPRKAKTPDALAIHSLVAMSQVAIADGRIDDAEVQQISSILTRLTGTSYAPQQVMELLSRLNPSPSDIDQIGEGLSDGDRQIVLEAALNIAVADGEIHPSEYAVVSDLAQRMRIGADQFRSAMARISAHLHTVPQA